MMVGMSTGERRRELDGLRGIAILLVLIGHAGAPHHLGALAAAGVTLFFALSGYLITGILTAEWQRTGRLNLRRFYARRMTRLAPPLLVMVVVMSLVAWPGWDAVLPAVTWTTNYAWLAGVDVGPFGHTWSLAVEEQFYLVWPLVLTTLLPTRRAVAVIGAATVALLFWRASLYAGGSFGYAYDAFETAGSAILAGAVVALARWRLPGRWAVVGLTGMLGVAAWAAAAEGAAWMVVPLLATPFAVLMLAGAPGATWLRAPWLVAFGVASYSLYLWHEPVSHLVDGELAPVGVAAGVLVGLVAYALVERPVMLLRATSGLEHRKVRGPDLQVSERRRRAVGLQSESAELPDPVGKLE